MGTTGLIAPGIGMMMGRMNFLRRSIPTVTKETALPGRSTPVLPAPHPHTVLGTAINEPIGPGQEEIFLASGCFWGAEKLMWNLGADSTAVGYMGGFTENPTYEETCTGLTGHTETVRVVYSPDVLGLRQILAAFFESHDPTSLNKQGGDIGTQYRSAIFTTAPDQYELAVSLRDAYQAELTKAGFAEIVTEIHAPPAPVFYYAEDYHQQYLDKNPGGYECHARTGIACPVI